MADMEKTLKKMALVLDRVVKKVEELDERVKKLEEKKGSFGSADFKREKESDVSKSNVKSTAPSSSSALAGVGSSFLGSLAGAVAGMGLSHLLFDDKVEPQQMAQQIDGDLEEKIEDIEAKLDNIDSELEELTADVEEFDDGISDADFENMSLDDYLAQEEDFEDFGDFDDV